MGYRYVGDTFGVAGLEAVASDTVTAPRTLQRPVAMEATLIAAHTMDSRLADVATNAPSSRDGNAPDPRQKGPWW